MHYSRLHLTGKIWFPVSVQVTVGVGGTHWNCKVSRGRKHGVFVEPLLVHERNCELVTIYLPSADSSKFVVDPTAPDNAFLLLGHVVQTALRWLPSFTDKDTFKKYLKIQDKILSCILKIQDTILKIVSCTTLAATHARPADQLSSSSSSLR